MFKTILSAVSPSNILILLLVAIVCSAGGYFKGKAEQREENEAEDAKMLRLAKMLDEKVATHVANIKINNQVIYRKAEREIIKEPVYRDCVHTADGLRLVNEALLGRSIGSSDRKLPRVPGGTDK